MTDKMKQSPPLRCVVLCDGKVFPAWQAESLRLALNSGHLEIVGLVERAPTRDDANHGKWRKRWRDRRIAGWRAFERIFVRPFSKAIKPVDLQEALTDVPHVIDEPIKVGRFGETPSQEALDFVRKLNPDVIVRFAYGILAGEILNIAPYGLWSYHHGDPSKFRGQPPGYWEMASGSSVAGAILQVLSERLDAGQILHRGLFQIAPHSYAKTRDTLYFGSAPWLARVAADIRLNGWERVAGRHLGATSNGPIFRQPTNRQVAKFALTVALGVLRVQSNYKLHRQQWNCAVIDHPINEVAGLDGAEAQRKALKSAIWMQPAHDEFFADPFGIEVANAQIKILVERYYWSQSKGVISSLTFHNGAFCSLLDEIVEDYHQSYPYIFNTRSVKFVIPEQRASGRLRGYEITRDDRIGSPVRLQLDSDLMDLTLVEHAGKVWAFALRDGETTNTELYLFYADRVEEKWHAHPLNPVKSDITSARPGGTPFTINGRLFRPAQDCASHYGSAISVNEITHLSETDFEEYVIKRVEPLPNGPYPYGLHTLSQVGGSTIIDGAQKQFRLWRR